MCGKLTEILVGVCVWYVSSEYRYVYVCGRLTVNTGRCMCVIS